MEIIFEGFCLGFVMFGILCIFAVGYLATKISAIIMAIIIGILYLLFIGIGIIGAISIKAAYSKAGKILGFILLVLGLTGGLSLFNRDEISDFIMEQKAKQQTAIIENAKTFLSIENQCDSENIELVEILFTPKTPNSSAVIGTWEQAWPSKSSSVPFEITNIPVAKNDTSFAIKLTTKDINRIKDGDRFKPFIYHKVFLEKKDINPNNESLIKIVYDGSKLLIENDNVIRNDEPFFTENTIIQYSQENYPLAIFINDMPILDPSTKWYSKYGKGYRLEYYNCLDNHGIPLNITMEYLEPGNEFIVMYLDHSTVPETPVERKFIAEGKNLILVEKNKYSVNYNPCFTKFDYVKAQF